MQSNDTDELANSIDHDQTAPEEDQSDLGLHCLLICSDSILRWMTCDFYVLFKSIYIISGQWVGDNKRLCAIESVYNRKDSRLQQGLNTDCLIIRLALNSLSYLS